ncbi:hypothetical protein CHS0354_042678 [Potamilus streckersoni]|uniref:Methyltransferase domain-containing protein n=1 Tax=Potamilus streckersoni TaxID=2493646 RepID=A0AAE0S9G6_9BIVA|nr:hypothetical protein CHS0354_042678 [Potamilus streckersoni]
MLLCRWKQPHICLWICSTFAFCIVGFLIIVKRTQTIEVIGKYFSNPLLSRSTQKVSDEKNTSEKHVVHRGGIVRDFPVKIPSDDELDNMTDTKLEDLFWDYINTIQALCQRVVRIGKIEDGGKEVCADDPYRPRPPCLVYSFGINNAWDFDEDAARIFGCEVFCFDPSMRDKAETYTYAKDITFYMIGLSATNEVLPDQWKMRTLEQIRRDLNHTERTIDILKIDIEGFEWNTLPQMVHSGTLRSVKQMQIELHGRGVSDKLKVLRMLYEDGFRIFMRDRNLNCKYSREGLSRERTSCMEVSMYRVTS